MCLADSNDKSSESKPSPTSAGKIKDRDALDATAAIMEQVTSNGADTNASGGVETQTSQTRISPRGKSGVA